MNMIREGAQPQTVTERLQNVSREEELRYAHQWRERKCISTERAGDTSSRAYWGIDR